ncbi:GNAT family N-acetyltransferase [Planococcus liqunii]|nr:GNAT family N-acetyltransferase [Planococcus sp. N056]WKA52330.1 GNAT family N-acetyltransferase [Planococcus sp. N056]
MMLFHDEKMTIRKLEDSDKEALVKWLSDPEVLKYFEGCDNPHDLKRVNQHYFERKDETTRCLVEYEGTPIGYIQFYPVLEEERMAYGYWNPDEVIYGTDQFIGEPDYWNRGLGTELVELMKKYLLSEKQADVLVMDPQVSNERAIACYEKCGFQKVKFLPAHELHEGEMKDCWLMEYKR